MTHVVVIGCGVVGATIAYELSLVPGIKITVLDKQPPAQAATAAALGVLMGVISHKTKGKAWQMRQSSILRYETLIPELVSRTGHQIRFNQQGILMLLDSESGSDSDLARWKRLTEIRAEQGWQLQIWDREKVKSRCPQIDSDRICAAIYSPSDRQVDPVSLTLALVAAAKSNGVTFHFGVTVEEYNLKTTNTQHQVQRIKTKTEALESFLIPDIDWLVVSAGLGTVQTLQGMHSSLLAGEAGGETRAGGAGEVGEAGGEKPLTSCLSPLARSPSSLAPFPIDIRPVLGQALHLKLSHPLGDRDFQPVITGNDVHIVPCNGVQPTEYWVGATVEFPTDTGDLVAQSACIERVMEQAIALCPALSQATVLRTWSGLRPRPEGQPAPIIGHLPGFSNVLLATGHYRNGVLLAPATAQIISEMILNS